MGRWNDESVGLRLYPILSCSTPRRKLDLRLSSEIDDLSGLKLRSLDDRAA